jgi:peptidoglycan hydrolase-like protein with peptidoglycan-binding domain
MRRNTIAAFVAAIMFAPLLTAAQTTSDTQAQMQAILSQIKALQEQLRTLVGSSTGTGQKPWMQGEGEMNRGQMGKMVCIGLQRNLRQGMQGDDVKKLQDMLSQEDVGFTASPNGFFGPMTARAMVKFQMKMGIASSTDGSVGPMTRGFFERRCGKGLMQGNDGMMQGPNGMRPEKDIMMKGAGAMGTIASVSGLSFTVTTQNGEMKTVTFTASTTIQVFTGTTTPPSSGSAADITVGKQVMAGGKTNANGTIEAMHIGIGFPKPPMMPGMQGQNGMMQGHDGMMGGMRPPFPPGGMGGSQGGQQ